MAFEHKEGYGALFKELEKKSANGPDYRGNVMVAGQVYELAGWIKQGAKGSFLSLKAQLPREQQEKREEKAAEVRRETKRDSAW